MKTVVFGFAFLMIQLSFSNVQVPIKKVVVFLHGAEIHHAGKVNLKAGLNEIVIEGLSSSVQEKTIQVSLGTGVKILSITSQKEILSDVDKNQMLKEKNDSLFLMNEKISYLKQVLDNYNKEEILLESNNARVGIGESVSIAELQKATDFYRTKFHEILDLKRKVNLEIVALNKQIGAIQSSIKELNEDVDSKSFQITISAKSTMQKQADLTLSYVITEAAWRPKYNIRGENSSSPILFEYMGEVVNKSGQLWDNVLLVLSTGDPFKSMDKPVLSPWSLNFNNHFYHGNNYKNPEGFLNERRVLNNEYREDVSSEKKSTSTNVEVSEVTVDFTIPNPYSIPSNGKPYLVEVKEYQLEASYKYYAVPKIEQDAFLIASVLGWEEVNIIDATANVYFANKYVGQTYLDTRYSNDSLEISLGRDSKINISRVKKEDFNKKKWIGLNPDSALRK